MSGVVNPGSVKARCTALDAVHGIAFFQQKFGKMSRLGR
jgi:hypothetical protein